MFRTFLMFIPQEAYLVALVCAGLLMVLGFRQIATGIIGTIVVLALFGPFIDALVDSLPSWLFALLILGFVLSIFRLIFGRGVTDQLIAFLLYDLLLAPLRFIRWLIRGFGPGGRGRP